MKPIYLLCLWNVRTGGPEAIHQLSDALIEQGLQARMVYYEWQQIAALEQAKPQGGYYFGARSNEIAEYARYKTSIADGVPNVPEVIVVLPETLCHLAPKFDKARVLIWWLSVDNGFGVLSRVNLNHLRKRNVRHAAQSLYAKGLVEALDLSFAGMLSDYTTDMSDLAQPMDWQARPMLALFNANHKVVHNVDQIMAEIVADDARFECRKLANLSRQEIAELLARARVYVDLGTFPGKDRLPREAARMGCIPIVAPVGAAAAGDFGDGETSPVRQIADCFNPPCGMDDGWAVRGQTIMYALAAPRPFEEDERGQFISEVRELFSGL
jgi:hypothetical protein